MACETNVAGTLKYAAPELKFLLESKPKGKQLINSNKADVYSLGITLVEVVVLSQHNIDLNTIDPNNMDSDAKKLQLKVNDLIDQMIMNEELKELLKRLLVVHPDERWSFRNFPSDIEVINEATVKFEFDDDENDELGEE